MTWAVSGELTTANTIDGAALSAVVVWIVVIRIFNLHSSNLGQSLAPRVEPANPYRDLQVHTARSLSHQQLADLAGVQSSSDSSPRWVQPASWYRTVSATWGIRYAGSMRETAPFVEVT